MNPRHIRTAVVTCAVALLAGCAASSSQESTARDLDALISFTDPAACAFSHETAKLLGGFVGGDGDTLSEEWILPGTVPEQLQDRLGPIKLTKHDGWWVVRTDARGTLWGLPLTAINQEFPEGGDPGGWTFEFAASPQAVERAARARGFVARAGKDVAMGEPDALVHAVGLHPSEDGQGATFGCGYS